MTNLDENTDSWLSHFGEESSQSEPKISPSYLSEYKLGNNILPKAVSGGAHCNPSYSGPILSGYSGSV